MTKLENIVYLSWEESERGWGTRPDGCSMHLNTKDCEKYVKNYWKGMPDEVPDEYSRPAGIAVPAFADTKLYHRIKRSSMGVRCYQHEERDLAAAGQLVYGKARSGWVST